MGEENVAVPRVPAHLALYFELRLWRSLLVPGGLLDQPDWTWDLITLAGQAYEAEARHVSGLPQGQ